MHSNQSIPYGSTGLSGSVTGRGEGRDRHSILYECLIPNRNVKDGVRSDSSLVGGASVSGTKGLECGCNGLIVLGGVVCKKVSVCCTGLLGRVRAYGVVPTAV